MLYQTKISHTKKKITGQYHLCIDTQTLKMLNKILANQINQFINGSYTMIKWVVTLFFLFIFGCTGVFLASVQPFSSFGEQGYSSLRARASHCAGFSCCGADSRPVGIQQLQLIGPSCGTQDWLTPHGVWRSSRIKDQTHDPHTGRQIPITITRKSTVVILDLTFGEARQMLHKTHFATKFLSLRVF